MLHHRGLTISTRLRFSLFSIRFQFFLSDLEKTAFALGPLRITLRPQAT
jgi:hypothetical protein